MHHYHRTLKLGRKSVSVFLSSRFTHTNSGNPPPIRIAESIHGRVKDYTRTCSSKSSPATISAAWRGSNRYASKAVAPLQLLRRVAITTFVPVGYPTSVHPSYLSIHRWQFFETTAGSAIGVLTAQAMLIAVGAADTAHATGAGVGMAIAVHWALKDGFGEVLKLAVINQTAHLIDTYPKTSKLVGEVSSVLGAALQLLTAVYPAQFLLLASLGIGLRGVHYSIWTATHTSFNQALAIQGNNIGDLVAKDESQLAVAHIVGMVILYNSGDWGRFAASVGCPLVFICMFWVYGRRSAWNDSCFSPRGHL